MLVSVVIPVHNGGAFLEPALKSLFAQTHRHLEIVCIDDGSTDTTAQALARLCEPRLRVVTNEQKQGLSRSLNRGIQATKGIFIARMDADDLAAPTRLEAQLNFLQSNPQVGVCATRVQPIGSGSKKGYYRPLEDTAIRAALLFDNPITHSTVMIRKELLESLNPIYDESLLAGEDFELWWRLSDRTCFATLPKKLVSYRVHANQFTSSNRLETRLTCNQGILRTGLTKFGMDFSDADLERHVRMQFGLPLIDEEEIPSLQRWLERLWIHNQHSLFVPKETFRHTLQHYWLRYLTTLSLYSPQTSLRAWASAPKFLPKWKHLIPPLKFTARALRAATAPRALPQVKNYVN